ncbi:hypothetical protein [Elizabethkingia sp. JS20170427COW]|uniref:hypothetical protein n=1 Tax=Elizabethkingia sp. JS20170427COW TaxID=2583851 RepID=UPI0011100ED9|nr:hypothetical protein [Elizabethkingia sp. JS20170427COW]QCX53054.1 hypothetical protein FGE20_04560 [Elizabethkingia sp. JS20170427COW]
MILSSFWPFYQYLWTVYFIIMFVAGFWGILFLGTFIVPLWLTEGLAEYYGKINKSFDPEQVRYKKLYEQEGVEVIYNNPKGHGPYLHSHH